MLRSYVEQRLETVVYRRIDDLLQTGHRLGALNTPPQLLGSELPRALDRSAGDLRRETIGVILRIDRRRRVVGHVHSYRGAG